MKRFLLMMAMVLVPTVALAQFPHASFFNGGTTLTATCTRKVADSVISSDVFTGTLQGNTSVTLPAANDCHEGDVIHFRVTQGTNHNYTLTVNAGAGMSQVVLDPLHAGTILAVPTSTAGATNDGLHQMWYNNTVAGTQQWELVTQETYPISNSIALAGSTSGTVTIGAAAAAGSVVVTPPVTNGTAGQALVSDGGAGTGYLWANIQATYTHTLTGATPTGVCNSATIPATDVQQEVLSAAVSSMTFPAHGACANGEKMSWIMIQSASGGPWAIPDHSTGTNVPFSVQSGDTLAVANNVICPQIGATQSATVPSIWRAEAEYIGSLSTWRVTKCENSPTWGFQWIGNSANVPTNTTSFMSFGQKAADTINSTTEVNSENIMATDYCLVGDVWAYVTTAPNGSTDPILCLNTGSTTPGGATSCAVACHFAGTSKVCHIAPYPDNLGAFSGNFYDVALINPNTANATGIVYASISFLCMGSTP